MTALEPGRIPMNEEEAQALDALFDELAGTDVTVVGLTRRDPGDLGPVVADLSNGDSRQL